MPITLPTPAFTYPRLAHFPEAPHTSGPEFTELAASAGLILDPWQSWVLNIGLGERDDGKWASFQNTVVVARQNGKDAIFEALGLGWLFITGERLIGHSAHEYKTAMEAFRRLVGLIENTDDLRRKVKKIINTNGEEGIELLPAPTIITGSSSLHTTIAYNQRMRFLARSKGAGRGFSFDKMIWNEAYALTAAQVDAVLPTLSARPNPQLWLGSSPPLDEATGEALFRARRAAEAGTAGVMMVDWGIEARLDKIGPCENEICSHMATEIGCILDDRAMWARTNPAYPYRISDEAIERERATMNPVGFARERGGSWPPDLSEGYTVISKKQWERLEDRLSGASRETIRESLAPVPNDERVLWEADTAIGHDADNILVTKRRLIGRPAVAVSVSSRAHGPVRGSISIAQRRADGKAHLELILFGPGSAWIPGMLKRFVIKNRPCAVVIDPGSPAGSIIADVQAQGVQSPGEPHKGIEVTTMSARDVAQAFGMIYDAATSENPEDRNVVHLGQSEMSLAVQGADKRIVGDGHAWDVRVVGTDITSIDSATKALWGLATKGNDPEPVMAWVDFG